MVETQGRRAHACDRRGKRAEIFGREIERDRYALIIKYVIQQQQTTTTTGSLTFFLYDPH